MGGEEPETHSSGGPQEATLTVRVWETSLRCAQDGPGPRTSLRQEGVFWPLCE